MNNPTFLDRQFDDRMEKLAPLAERMRPATLDEFTGQEHILAPGRILHRMIAADRITSAIFYGPPGTGKTTAARLIAKTTGKKWRTANAVTSGVKELRDVIDESRREISYAGPSTILFVDEIHRFNKAQQDVLLGAVEDGIITLIGATTENPLYEINSALVSRSTLFEFRPLEERHIEMIARRALTDPKRGLGGMRVELTDEAMRFITRISNGDARIALNALELAALTTTAEANGAVRVDLDVIQECAQKRAVNYDKTGDGHYDAASAFIKSMRGSDPDAALYWMAVMLHAGEDPKFIARRMVIFASEDIGNAQPYALLTATAAFYAVTAVGLPECALNLAHAVTFLASCPKSNSATVALDRAVSDVRSKPTAPVPDQLINAPPGSGKETGYLYPHDFALHVARQDYLPAGYTSRPYYEPGELGFEKEIASWLERARTARTGQEPPRGSNAT